MIDLVPNSTEYWQPDGHLLPGPHLFGVRGTLEPALANSAPLLIVVIGLITLAAGLGWLGFALELRSGRDVMQGARRGERMPAPRLSPRHRAVLVRSVYPAIVLSGVATTVLLSVPSIPGLLGAEQAALVSCAGLFVVSLLYGLARAIAARDVGRDLCGTCGYPLSDVGHACPECGRSYAWSGRAGWLSKGENPLLGRVLVRLGWIVLCVALGAAFGPLPVLVHRTTVITSSVPLLLMTHPFTQHHNVYLHEPATVWFRLGGFARERTRWTSPFRASARFRTNSPLNPMSADAYLGELRRRSAEDAVEILLPDASQWVTVQDGIDDLLAPLGISQLGRPYRSGLEAKPAATLLALMSPQAAKDVPEVLATPPTTTVHFTATGHPDALTVWSLSALALYAFLGVGLCALHHMYDQNRSSAWRRIVEQLLPQEVPPDG